MAAKKASKNSEPKLRFTVRHALTNIYIVLLFTAFPLFLSNYYSAARRDKFWFFLILTAVIGLSVGIITIVDEFSKNNEYNRKLNTYRDPFKLSVTDIGFMAFVGVSLVSMLTSGRIAHSFMGLSGSASNGRNMGFLTILLLFVGYMVISRFFYFNKIVFYCLFAGISIVSLLAILNYYYIDPLGYFAAYEGSSSYDTVLNDFTSTIGNKNYLSALICVALPFSLGVAIATEDSLMRTIAYVSTGVQFAGLIVATSDGGYLGCIIAFAIIAVVISRDAKKLSRFCFGIAVMMVAAKLLFLLDLLMDKNSKGYTSFSEFFIYRNAVYVVLVVFALLAVALYYLNNRRKDELLPKAVLFVFLGAVCAAAVAFIALIVYFTFINTTETLTGFKRFLRFDESWGTHRGYFWIKSFEVYGDMNIWQKLFGAGPESFYFKFEPYFPEMVTKFAESSTNAAHNVYVNYLITHGIVGLLAYLAFVGAAIWSCAKNAKSNPLALVCLGVIVAYAAQDFVNIANPVNTPWFIAFIALSESTALRANRSERLLAENF